MMYSTNVHLIDKLYVHVTHYSDMEDLSYYVTCINSYKVQCIGTLMDIHTYIADGHILHDTDHDNHSVFHSCRVVLVATESVKKAAQEQEARVISSDQPIVGAKHSMGTSCQVVLYSSRSFSSSLPPSNQEVLSAVMKTRQDVS